MRDQSVITRSGGFAPKDCSGACEVSGERLRDYNLPRSCRVARGYGEASIPSIVCFLNNGDVVLTQ